MTKICSKCKREIDIFNFNKGNNKNNLTYWCKNCIKEYYNKNKKKLLLKKKQYRKKHKKEIKEYLKKYYQKYKEEARKRHKF